MTTPPLRSFAKAVAHAAEDLRHTEERSHLAVERARQELIVLKVALQRETSRDPTSAADHAHLALAEVAPRGFI